MPIDFSNAWKTGVKIINQAIALIPNLIIALLIFALFRIEIGVDVSGRDPDAVAADITDRLQAQKYPLEYHAEVVGDYKSADTLHRRMFGAGLAAVVGILLLLQEPFRIGDLISVIGIEGTVDDIQSRATVITTKEGRQVIIPNALIFTSPVAVEHLGGQKLPETSGASAGWSDMLKHAFRRPSSPGAK